MKSKRQFTNEFKREIIAQLLSGTSTAAQLCRKHQISSAVLYHWKKRYERGKFDNEPTANGALLERIAELERKFGQVMMENDLAGCRGPSRPLRQTCQTMKMPRSSYLLPNESQERGL